MNKLPIRLAAGSGPTFGVDDLSCAAATHLGLWEDEGLDVTWTPSLFSSHFPALLSPLLYFLLFLQPSCWGQFAKDHRNDGL